MPRRIVCAVHTQMGHVSYGDYGQKEKITGESLVVIGKH